MSFRIMRTPQHTFPARAFFNFFFFDIFRVAPGCLFYSNSCHWSHVFYPFQSRDLREDFYLLALDFPLTEEQKKVPDTLGFRFSLSSLVTRKWGGGRIWNGRFDCLGISGAF